ncbi:DUF1398 domain-containing protein [Sphingobacterium humi]|uniref:DUF1398 domain-containing protein n=1 Tax=Sphingobacterium humi TaxID=1796905 RepID=A0A6N8KVI5_9SPHI|nr:DUF1398 family protein [Sphingobacterium humi]MVZ61137.1 DUF1398 domain-containing protein [Sphingobacterium humi]
MFTISQIEAAQAKVQTGADFPAYLHDIKQLGVIAFTFEVSSSRETYIGNEGFQVSSVAKYEEINIAPAVNAIQFQRELKEHQEGKSDFPYFIQMCAAQGIASWKVDLLARTCCYYDLQGGEVFIELIPA